MAGTLRVIDGVEFDYLFLQWGQSTKDEPPGPRTIFVDFVGLFVLDVVFLAIVKLQKSPRNTIKLFWIIGGCIEFVANTRRNFTDLILGEM